jgi:hypothetical protein
VENAIAPLFPTPVCDVTSCRIRLSIRVDSSLLIVFVLVKKSNGYFCWRALKRRRFFAARIALRVPVECP